MSGNSEIVLIVEAVAREKDLPKEMLMSAIEEGMRVAAKKKYGGESVIKVRIDRKTGEMKVYKETLVISDEDFAKLENEELLAEDELLDLRQLKQDVNLLGLTSARHIKSDVVLGEKIVDLLPPLDMGRSIAQSAKQVIMHKLKELERLKNYEEFKDKLGEIVSAVVERIEIGGLVVKVASAEAFIPNDQLILDEKKRIKQGDRMRVLVSEVNLESRGAQIVLSRTSNQFLIKLFAQEVPEIYDRVIEVKSVARDPGRRAKIAVHSKDPSIDPVGSCVGMRGSRVQAVINELGGEKIDIIPWTNDTASLVINALAPAEVTKVIIDEDNRKIEVVVPEAHQSIAIGKRGQNVRLASKLLGWDLDIMTEELESKRRVEEFNAITERFINALDLEEILAQLLASEGYNSIQSIADANIADLASIEGLDEAIAEELSNRAKEYANTHANASSVPVGISMVMAKIDSRIAALPNMTDDLMMKLYEANLIKLQDIADLSRDEFCESIEDSMLSEDAVDELIMSARKQIYF